MLPLVDNIVMVFHVLFFFAILIATAALLRKRPSAQFVFTNFSNGTGWDSDVIAWGISMMTSAYIMIVKCFPPCCICSKIPVAYICKESLPGCISDMECPPFAGYYSAIHMSEEMHNPKPGSPAP